MTGRLIFLAPVLLATSAATVSAQLRTYCFEGARYSCFGVEVLTQPDPVGTAVTIRVANLQGAPLPNVPSQTPWMRIHGIELIGGTPSFGGSWIGTADPTLAPTGAATATGDIRERWFSYNSGEAGASYRGYALVTPYNNWGADIVGCTKPPDEDYPYLTTCSTNGPGAVEFKFTTEGTWQAGQAAVVVRLGDPYDPEQSCMIAGSTFDDPTAYHCLDLDAPQPPSTVTVSMILQPSRISLSATSVVNVVLLSQAGFDATQVDPHSVRLNVGGGSDALPAQRGTSVITAISDYNGDGQADRLIAFTVAALKTAGLSTDTRSLTLHPASGSAWSATTGALPFVP